MQIPDPPRFQYGLRLIYINKKSSHVSLHLERFNYFFFIVFTEKQSCPDGLYEHGQSCYFLSDDTLTYADAMVSKRRRIDRY